MAGAVLHSTYLCASKSPVLSCGRGVGRCGHVLPLVKQAHSWPWRRRVHVPPTTTLTYRTCCYPCVLASTETWRQFMCGTCDTVALRWHDCSNMGWGCWRLRAVRDWGKLRNEELHDLCHQIEENKMAGACGTCGEENIWIQNFGGENWREVITWQT